MGFQTFIAMGNVTREPEIKQVGEKEVANFGIAVNGYKDSVEFFDLAWWSPNGAIGYIDKGTPVLVEGEIQTQRWEKDGEKREKKVIQVRKLTLCGGGKKERDPAEADFATPF